MGSLGTSWRINKIPRVDMTLKEKPAFETIEDPDQARHP